MPPDPLHVREHVELTVQTLGFPPSYRSYGRMVKDADAWANAYWSGPGYGDWLADPDHGRDLARPFVVFAALHHARANWAGRWQRFLELTFQDVAAAAADWQSRERVARGPHELMVEVEWRVRDLLRGLPDEPPHFLWLEQIYRYAFTLYDCPQPAGLPDWWDELFGHVPAPPGGILPPPPPPPPPAGQVLPDDDLLDTFVDEECQDNEGLRRVLNGFRKTPCPLQSGGRGISDLQFLYLRYRHSPAAGDDIPTPEAGELANFLKDRGGKTATGEPITAGYISKLLQRLRDDALEELGRQMAAGALPAASADWLKKVFPRPNWYTYGALFPPLPRPAGETAAGAIGGAP